MLLSHLSLEFICRAFASILAPMSPMAFPLISKRASVELLPSAFSTMDRSLFSLESARDREVRGCRMIRERRRGMCGEGDKSVDRVSVQFNLNLSTVYLWERATTSQTHIWSSKRIQRFERCCDTWKVQDLNCLWSENDTKPYKVSAH